MHILWSIVLLVASSDLALAITHLSSVRPEDTWRERQIRDERVKEALSDVALQFDATAFDAKDVGNTFIDRHDWSRSLDSNIEKLIAEYNTNLVPQWTRFKSLGPMGPECLKLEKYGNGDSEKRACGLSSHLASTGCKILSIGSNNEWNFEEEIVKFTNCTVDTFDCTGDGKNWSVPEALRGRVRLHEVCLSSESKVIGARRYVTYKDMLAMAGTTDFPAYLKMDIEGWEFDVLRSIVDSHAQHGSALPMQIAFELHYINWDTSNSGMSWARRQKGVEELALFMDYLWRFGNYYVVDRRDNGSCSACTELLLVRIPKGR